MANVVFIDPKGDQVGLNMGLAYLASSLINKGHKVKVIDFNNYHKDENERLKAVYNADIIGFSIKSFTIEESWRLLLKVKNINYKAKIICGGAHISTDGYNFLKNNQLYDIGIIGDGEDTIIELAEGTPLNDIKGIVFNKSGKIIKTEPRELLMDLDRLPFPNYGCFDSISKYKINWPYNNYPLITSRGCPCNCLSGDTLINTVEGDVPIKDLVGKDKIGVYTYDRKTKQVFIADAINIRKTGTNQKMVRVTFDDDTHIDCTPDHKFLTFKSGNQHIHTREYVKEAKDLKPKNSVRAIKSHQTGVKRKSYSVCWGRGLRRLRHLLVMEYLLGRKLVPPEKVHHKDLNPNNDLPSNLILCKNHKEHISVYHPEFSERMKKDNPCKYWTDESGRKVSVANKGKKRTLETREKMRLAALGEKNHNYGNKASLETRLKLRVACLGKNNPHYKNGKYFGKKQSKIKEVRENEINHKVVSVETIPNQDVYCMEVPSTNWFFANQVLVHNCVYCSVPLISGRRWRSRSPENVFNELKQVKEKYGINAFQISDDNFTVNIERAKQICRLIKPLNLEWECPNGIKGQFTDEELIRLMAESGMFQVNIGIESAVPEVFNQIGKGGTLDDIKLAIKRFNKYGVRTAGFFLVGMPFSSYELDKKSLELSKGFELDQRIWSFIVPYPGTRLFEMIQEKPDYYKMVADWKTGQDLGRDPEPIFERPDYLTTQLTEMYYVANIKSRFYGAITDMNATNIRKAWDIFSSILLYDPLHLFTHLYHVWKGLQVALKNKTVKIGW